MSWRTTSDVRRTGAAGESGPVTTTSTTGTSAAAREASTESIASATASPERLELVFHAALRRSTVSWCGAGTAPRTWAAWVQEYAPALRYASASDRMWAVP